MTKSPSPVFERSTPMSRPVKICYKDRHAIDALTSSYFFSKYSFAFFPPVTATSDVIDQFYVGLFLGVELALVIIRVGAKFRL